MSHKLSALLCGSLLVASLALPYTSQAKDICEDIDIAGYDEYEGVPIPLSLAQKDDLKLLETYLKCGADPNQEFGEDWILTTTSWVIYDGGSIPALELLVKYGGIIDYPTVLSELYTQNSSVEMLEYLIKKGAGIHIRAEEDYYYEPAGVFIEDAGKTPLMSIAQDNSNPAILLALLKHGADPKARDYRGRYPYDYTLRWNKDLHSSEAVQILKKAKEEDSKRDVFLKEDFWKNASLTGVKKALKNGSNVHAKDSSHVTPIMYAAQYSGKIELIKELVRQGADLSRADNRGQTVLFYAIRGKVNKEGIDYLVNNGAKINHTDMLGNTVLHLLSNSDKHFYLHEEKKFEASEKYIDAALSLLAAGADVNIQNNAGNTPLHTVALKNYGFGDNYENHQALFKILLEAKADPSIKNNNGSDIPKIIEDNDTYRDIFSRSLKK